MPSLLTVLLYALAAMLALYFILPAFAGEGSSRRWGWHGYVTRRPYMRGTFCAQIMLGGNPPHSHGTVVLGLGLFRHSEDTSLMIQLPAFWRCAAGEANPGGYLLSSSTHHLRLFRGASLSWAIISAWHRLTFWRGAEGLVERILPSKPVLATYIKQASGNAWNTADEVLSESYEDASRWPDTETEFDVARREYADAHFDQAMRAYFGNDRTPLSL